MSHKSKEHKKSNTCMICNHAVSFHLMMDAFQYLNLSLIFNVILGTGTTHMNFIQFIVSLIRHLFPQRDIESAISSRSMIVHFTEHHTCCTTIQKISERWCCIMWIMRHFIG